LKFLMADEIIITAVDLISPWQPGRMRN